jgi:hypothetical protein
MALPFANLAAAQTRSAQLATNMGCDGVFTQFWHQCDALTDGTAILVVQGRPTVPQPWSSTVTYSAGSAATYTTGTAPNIVTHMVVSKVEGNLNHNPLLDPTHQWWLAQPVVWSATTTYVIGSAVYGSDNFMYASLQANNLNNDPTTSPTWWHNTGATTTTAITYDGPFGTKPGPTALSQLTPSEISSLKNYAAIAPLLPPPPAMP